jgi:hypothetical protein
MLKTLSLPLPKGTALSRSGRRGARATFNASAC